MAQHTAHPNVDPQEVAKFAEQASDWWNPNGNMKPLHQINPLRLQFIQGHVELQGKRVLDVGCGGGILTESLAKAGAIVTGLDMAEASIEVAKSHAKAQDLSIHYVCQPVESLVATDARAFDVIVCMEMLEHVPAPEAIVSACAKLLKPNGSAFFSTLNRNATSYLKAIVAAEYVLKLLPKGTHEYSKFIKPSELDSWCRQHQLLLKKTLGLSYNPLSGQYRTTPDISVNYLAFCQKNG